MSKSTNVLFAALTGFVAGILLAPKSGEETRSELKAKAKAAKEQLDEKGSDTMEALKKGADRANVELRGMAGSAQESFRNVSKEAASLGNEAKDRAGRVADETKQSSRKGTTTK